MRHYFSSFCDKKKTNLIVYLGLHTEGLIRHGGENIIIKAV